ncbi:hypothetical protein [Paenibacillus sacheonensis]|uniref:Uncharacterized protein n=1 Tax=Paenibacillus sacheonensis TaxID=742054 RepID=A0A7X4YRN4_9BACL|nr:hypothetical protein [Paenibacillus sacheonensis]MBM7567619.1 hypothetical protein [Paenibacillus sacheonensis]NBC71278.1 hypothetical protein [Paenibacillus sacheonensis]
MHEREVKKRMKNEEALFGGTGLVRPLRRLRAGRVTADFMEDGSLKYIRYGSVELLRHLHPTLRDQDWGSAAGEVSELRFHEDEDAVQVTYRLDYRGGEVDFGCAIVIRLSSAGRVSMSMDGEARSGFRKNRLGFCLLHPMDSAGACVEATTPDGIVLGRFPELVSPGDPFAELKAMRIYAGGLTTHIMFLGDLFQTEDQRNWTDGSFKTFCTPLRLPYPVVMQQGEKVMQAVTIDVTDDAGSLEGGQEIEAGSGTARMQAVVRREQAFALPALGTLLPPMDGMPPARVVGLLRELGLSQLRCEAELSLPDWKTRIEAAAELALELGLAYELQLIAEPDETALREAAAAIAALAPAPLRIAVFPAAALDVPTTSAELYGASLNACRYVTDDGMAALLKRLLNEAAAAARAGAGVDAGAAADTGSETGADTGSDAGGGAVSEIQVGAAAEDGGNAGGAVVETETEAAVGEETGSGGGAESGIEVGGGSRGNFAELNRVALPMGLSWDFAEFAVNPQVHASDLASIAETLPAQGIVCRTAIASRRDMPVRIGAVTLKQRMNPYSAGEEGVQRSRERGNRLDPRQSSSFAAAWLIGSVAQLAREGIASANYFEAFGPLGFMDEDGGNAYPVHAAMKLIGEFREGEALQVDGLDPSRVAALGLRGKERVVVLLANLTADELSVLVDLSEWKQPNAAISRLRGASSEAAAAAGAAERAEESEESASLQPDASVTLQPFETYVIEFRA